MELVKLVTNRIYVGRLVIITIASSPTKQQHCRYGRFPSLTFVLVISPAGAVAKYCNAYVHVGVSVCPREYLPNHTRDLYQVFCACCLSPRFSVLIRRGDEIPRGRAIFGFCSPLTMHYTAEHLGPMQKRLNRSRCRLR